MNKNTRQATQVAPESTQETEITQQQGFQDFNELSERRFGINDIWRIRKSSKSLRIHNRIPRL